MLSIDKAWSTVLPFNHSVARDEEAIAEPQPKVLNLASLITPVYHRLLQFEDA
jgi:hypothetical protein